MIMYDNVRDAPPRPTMVPSQSPERYPSYSPPSTRDSSPSPSVSSTPALSVCSSLSRSFSANSSTTNSSVSTTSQASVTPRSVSASGAVRQRRGYVRPQGVSFAPSAGNRDSVLSLGSIAHLQYYFARTGLLDGKGGQLAKEEKNKDGSDKLSTKIVPNIRANPDSGPGPYNSIGSSEETHAYSSEPLMLPPTVSTYSHRIQYLPPPPDPEALRHDLNAALASAKKTLQEVSDQNQQDSGQRKPGPEVTFLDGDRKENMAFSQSPGWFEIQGINILDVVTLAIRAAKIYYTSHANPHRLYSIKSERQVREELLSVLDVLKRMASRNFAGGIRDEELKLMRQWVEGIEAFLAKEIAKEEQEGESQDSWVWLEGSWQGQERRREWLFLRSFLPEGDLPEWTAPEQSSQTPTPFLEVLRTGLVLVRLHNSLLKKSKRQFGEIKSFHTDTTKPYRCSENLRYWIKAADIRWETKLMFDVPGVVNSRNEAWMDFDKSVLQWSRAVREELTKELKEATTRPYQETKHPADQQNA